MKNTLEAACKRYRGWGKLELATLLEKEGVARSTVYAWFTGLRVPHSKHLDMLCSLLGCTLNDLYVTEPYDFKDEMLRNVAEKRR